MMYRDQAKAMSITQTASRYLGNLELEDYW
jgi:hypothetical protein